MALGGIGASLAGGVASSATSSLLSGGGGKGGASAGGGAQSQTAQDRLNFAPFQAPAISRVFDILGGGAGEQQLLGGTGRDSLLQVPPQASGAINDSLGFLRDVFRQDDAGSQGLLNFGTLLNEDISKQPFNPAIDRFEGIGDSAEGAFAPFIQAALGLGQQGANTEFRDILGGFAREDPFSNPFVDRITSDALADQAQARADQGILSGGLGGPGQSQAAQREAGRLSADIRGKFGESSRNRALSAAGTGAQFDLSNAAQRLNALIGGGNLTNQRFGVELGAAQGVLGGTQAEAQRRNQLLGLRGQNESQLANLPFQGLNAVGPLAESFTTLPFLPLANFAEIATTPLGSTQTGGQVDQTNLSIFDLISQGVSGASSLGGIGQEIFRSFGGGSPTTGVPTGGTGIGSGGFGPFGTADLFANAQPRTGFF